MRILKAFLVFLALLLLLVGIGIRVLVDSEPDIYTLDGHAAELGIERVDPGIVSALLGKGIRIDDAEPITLDDLLEGTDEEEAIVAKVIYTLYAYSTWIIVLGAFLLIYGATLRRRDRSENEVSWHEEA
ncbi:MAG: hypothetical protein J6K73_13710 [Clostridia bacterium]|nr:hypothetical protein [Clostridia bacterium]